MNHKLLKRSCVTLGLTVSIFFAVGACSAQDAITECGQGVREKLNVARPDLEASVKPAVEVLPLAKPTPTLPKIKAQNPQFLLGDDFKRWFDIDTFSLTTRYRNVRANNGSTLASQQQWQLQFRPRFKFDKKGKFSVSAGIATGNVFTAGFDNTGWGTGRGQTNLYVKQMFFDAKPSKKIEIQFGGIAINLGESSEITAFDVDGYLTGERIVIRHPKAVYFDEVSLTNAYLGDLTRPSIFRRLHRLDDMNYHQFLVRKQASKAVGFSADYTFWGGADIFHQAVRVKPKKFFLTTMLFDTYQRVSSPRGFGFNAFAEKAVNKHFIVNGGFARLDPRLTLNADRFAPGKRLYASISYRPSTMFSITPFIAQGVGRLPAQLSQRTRLDIVMTWNILETLHKYRIF